MGISITTTGSEIVIENLNRLRQRAGNMNPAFSKIADLMQKSHDSNFKMYGSRFGNKWADRKRVYSWPILQKTGALSKSFKTSHTNKSATIENIVPHAKYHQFGTSKMPARPIVGWADQDLNEIVRIIRKNILEF